MLRLYLYLNWCLKRYFVIIFYFEVTLILHNTYVYTYWLHGRTLRRKYEFAPLIFMQLSFPFLFSALPTQILTLIVFPILFIWSINEAPQNLLFLVFGWGQNKYSKAKSKDLKWNRIWLASEYHNGLKWKLISYLPPCKSHFQC